MHMIERSGKRSGRLVGAFLTILIVGALAAHPVEAKKKRVGREAPAAATEEPKGAEPLPPPYRAQITRLAELLGALAYLDEICPTARASDWGASMKALVDAEARTDLERDVLAGAFNRSYRTYRITYRSCTQNARAVIARFLVEGRRIAHEVVDRYGAS